MGEVETAIAQAEKQKKMPYDRFATAGLPLSNSSRFSPPYISVLSSDLPSLRQRNSEQIEKKKL